jgi:hypothetical protein
MLATSVVLVFLLSVSRFHCYTLVMELPLAYKISVWFPFIHPCAAFSTFHRKIYMYLISSYTFVFHARDLIIQIVEIVYFISYVCKVKFSPLQALEALRVVRGWGSHIF